MKNSNYTRIPGRPTGQTDRSCHTGYMVQTGRTAHKHRSDRFVRPVSNLVINTGIPKRASRRVELITGTTTEKDKEKTTTAKPTSTVF